MMIPQEFQKYVLIGMAVLAVACILLGIFLILQIRKRKLEAKKAESAMESMKAECFNKLNSITGECEELISKFERQNSDLQRDCRMKIDTAKGQCADEIQAMQKRCENDMQALKEKIETDKQELQAKPEKELLVDILYAMGGYGDRISRLETVLQNEVSTIQYDIGSLRSSVEDRSEADGVGDKIESLSSEVSSIRWDIDSIKSACEEAKSAAEEAKSAAEDVKYAIESKDF